MDDVEHVGVGTHLVAAHAFDHVGVFTYSHEEGTRAFGLADDVPAMGNTYVEGADGKPRIVRNPTVNMGLAVDVDKGDGTRTLVVPVRKSADTRKALRFFAERRVQEVLDAVRTMQVAVPGGTTRSPSKAASGCTWAGSVGSRPSCSTKS